MDMHTEHLQSSTDHYEGANRTVHKGQVNIAY